MPARLVRNGQAVRFNALNSDRSTAAHCHQAGWHISSAEPVGEERIVNR